MLQLLQVLQMLQFLYSYNVAMLQYYNVTLWTALLAVSIV